MSMVTYDSLLAGAKYSCISPRGGRGSSADIKGIFDFKCRRISLPILFNFIEVISRLKVLVILEEDLPLSLFLAPASRLSRIRQQTCHCTIS
jgi:hypothetical protein